MRRDLSRREKLLTVLGMSVLAWASVAVLLWLVMIAPGVSVVLLVGSAVLAVWSWGVK
jgi:hypothetical protein